MWLFDSSSGRGQDELENPNVRFVNPTVRLLLVGSLFRWLICNVQRLKFVFLLTFNHADGTTVYDALVKGFDDLMDLCDIVTEKFTEARDRFTSTEQTEQP